MEIAMGNAFTSDRRLRAGDWVRVRTKEEILTTLDENGRLDELPFMPEMLRYCGTTMRVSKRAHKTCDPAVGIIGRKMASTVHLENIRCDGSAHDGCQAGCLIIWKEAWLKRMDGEPGIPDRVPSREGDTFEPAHCTEDALRSSVRIPAAAGES